MSETMHLPMAGVARPAVFSRSSRLAVTGIAIAVSVYFVLVAACIYWLCFLPAAAMAWLVPKRTAERVALPMLVLSSLGVAALTQTIPGFFPDYSSVREVLLELALWCGVGVFARSYLVYTGQPETFEGIRESIASRRIDRWFADNLHNPLDAAFVRIWIGNLVATAPITVLLVTPQTLNYFVVAAWSAALLLVLFPQDLVEHTHMHNRLFTAKIGSSDRVKRILRVCQFVFEYPVTLLTIRIPEFYRIQHVYVHHVEGNGPEDTQSTIAYDRTSFLDFSRHALLQGCDLLTGCLVIPYLMRKGKKRQVREVLAGMAVFYALVVLVGIFNPITAGLIIASRLVGGQVLSFFSFFQHGLIDPEDVDHVHGNTINYHGHEHGHLGADFHVEHHLKPARHWSAYCEEAAKETAAHEEGHRAVVVEKGFYSPLGMMRALWTRDYAGVAARAQMRGMGGDAAKLAALIEERTKPIGAEQRKGVAAKFDQVLGFAMGWALPVDLSVGP